MEPLGRSDIETASHVQKRYTSLPLESTPERQSLLSHTHVKWVAVDKTEDARRSMRRASLMTRFKLLEENNLFSPARKAPGGGHSHNTTADDYNLD
jgi:hypothetical protein